MNTPLLRLAGVAALLAVTSGVAGCSRGELAPSTPVPTAQASPSTPGDPGATPTAAPAGAAPSSATPSSAAPVTSTVPVSTGDPAKAAPSPSGPRPATGREFVRTGARGSGELVVENGTRDDGYVTLVRDGRARVAVYVRAGATTRVRGIADGTYELYYSTGSAWNNPLRAFTSDASTERFDETFPFRTDARSSTEWTVSLQTTPDGTASSSPVDPASVPR